MDSHTHGVKPRRARTLAAALFLATLAGGLIGCGGAAPTAVGERYAKLPSAPPDSEALPQEQYNHFEDNAYQSAATDPVSTFSTDVNTASYSNVRRHLESNQSLPPKDSVRIAELVNYFPYSYPNPAGADPVSITVDLAPCPWQPRHHLARIGVKAKEIPASEMPPRNLVFLIDTSGSMEGANRLPLVKKSLNLLIDTLTAKDTVSIVTYAGETALKLRPTPGHRKWDILSVVNSLWARGSTNGSSGIQMAYEQARASFIENGINRVILCTDGDFNVGVTSQGDLVRLIEEQRVGNVFLTVLGFGMGNLKDGTLEKLANHGNGHYAYIDSEAEAHKVFVEQGAALVTVAKDVKLQVHFNPRQVNAYRLIGYENRMLKNEDFKNDAKDAGDMGSGHTVTALYEIVPVGVEIDPALSPSPLAGEGLGVRGKTAEKPLTPNPSPARGEGSHDSGEWLTVKMRYKHPTAMTSQELEKPLAKDALGKPVHADFRFAALVAEWGLLLRDSPYKGMARYDHILDEADSDVAGNRKGHRNEFFRLVRISRQYAENAAATIRPKSD